MRALLLTSLLCLAQEARTAAATFIELESACPIWGCAYSCAGKEQP